MDAREGNSRVEETGNAMGKNRIGCSLRGRVGDSLVSLSSKQIASLRDPAAFLLLKRDMQFPRGRNTDEERKGEEVKK